MQFWKIVLFNDFNVLINIFHALNFFKLLSIYIWLQHWLYIVVNGILKYILDTFLRYVICSTSHMYFIRFLCPSSLCRYLNTLFIKVPAGFGRDHGYMYDVLSTRWAPNKQIIQRNLCLRYMYFMRCRT